MGAAPSSPGHSEKRPAETAEYLVGTFVGEKSFPLGSDFWQKLLELPLHLRWPADRVREACQLFAQNNSCTRHLAKILIHLAQCLQECMSVSGAPLAAYVKASNAAYISSVFLKHLIENAQSNSVEGLYLSLNASEPIPPDFVVDQNVEHLVMHNVLKFIGLVDVSPNTCSLHQELLNFLFVALSTQLLYAPTPGPTDMNPFIDAAMTQESSLVTMVVHRLLLNYIMRPRIALNVGTYLPFGEAGQPGVLQRVGSAAANLVLLPFNYLVSSNGQGVRNPLAECSLHVLLILNYYRKCNPGDESITDTSDDSGTSDSFSKSFVENPYCKALENMRDIDLDRVDIEKNAHNPSVVRLPFASLFDTLGMCLTDETAALLLYTLLNGNSDFLEYVLVRTDVDTLLMPILETLYNTSRRSSNHIYILLIILLILSQDSSFNASIHKMILASVPWYQEHLLHQTSLGSLMVIILIRTVKYNLSKLKDLYLHTTCLATLANMAPHVHRLSAYASQRLVSLFYMLSRKYNKLAERIDEKRGKGGLVEENDLTLDMSAELHIYADFLRIVLEILNAILTYALPRNPEVVYAIMHRQEVFQPFKSHPRFNELIENIFLVLDHFNSRIDAQKEDGEWSVEKVLQLIISICRSWRGEGMKMFTQLHFSYEQESHPEEFFAPYIWRLTFSQCGYTFDPSAIILFPPDLPLVEGEEGEQTTRHENGELKHHAVLLDV
ncbi:unnamed protein product [Linum trigynum]|uniref:Dymeclin n=1 Tax=Linum trigynum TaxID=586398 RepID=A0AAV2FE59_9ROSI